MVHPLRALAIAVTLAVAACPARAADSGWMLRTGYARATFDPATVVHVAGQGVPGAEVDVPSRDVLLGDVGREVGGRWIARVAFGLPIEVPVVAAGTLAATLPAAAGPLGEVEIAPLLGTLLYAPLQWHGVRPYAGFGAGYVFVLDATDGAVESLHASGAWVPVLQAGCDVEVTSRLSLFVDARWMPLETRVTGSLPDLGGLGVEADVQLDPTVISAGVGYRF